MNEWELQRRRGKIASGKSRVKWGVGIGLVVLALWATIKILTHWFAPANALIDRHQNGFLIMFWVGWAFILIGATGIKRATTDENDDDAWKEYENIL